MSAPAGNRSTWRLGGHVVAAASDSTSTWAAFALGTGKLRLVDLANQVAHASREVTIHDGAILSLAPIPGGGFVVGGDDGLVRRVATDGTVSDLKSFGGKWIECVRALPDGRVLASVGRAIQVIAPDGSVDLTLGPHPSTLTVFDVVGDLVAVPHYNGATLHDLSTSPPKPTLYPWKGSHIAAAISPDRQFLASSLQEGEVHGWRLADGSEMRMAGYPGKVKSIAWSADSHLLATAGATLLAAWPFDGPGPEGRPPVDLYEGEATVTRVACHPLAPLVAGGFGDGMVVIADVASRRSGRYFLTKTGAISALAWSPDGRHLLAGAEDGRAAIFTIPAPSA